MNWNVLDRIVMFGGQRRGWEFTCSYGPLYRKPIGTLNAPPRHGFLEPERFEDFTKLYLVPGGRYLVIDDTDCLSVWDLGYVSNDDTGFV